MQAGPAVKDPPAAQVAQLRGQQGQAAGGAGDAVPGGRSGSAVENAALSQVASSESYQPPRVPATLVF